MLFSEPLEAFFRSARSRLHIRIAVNNLQSALPDDNDGTRLRAGDVLGGCKQHASCLLCGERRAVHPHHVVYQRPGTCRRPERHSIAAARCAPIPLRKKCNLLLPLSLWMTRSSMHLMKQPRKRRGMLGSALGARLAAFSHFQLSVPFRDHVGCLTVYRLRCFCE